MWWSKHLKSLSQKGRVVVLEGGPRWGVPYLLAHLEARHKATVRLQLPPDSDSAPIRLGNQLADAVTEALGAPLFGYGLPYQYGVGVIERHAKLLSPVFLVIEGAENGKEFVQNVLPLSRASVTIILWYRGDPRYHLSNTFDQVIIGERDLRLSLAEAERMVPKNIEPDVVSRCLLEADGAIEDFLRLLNAEAGLPFSPVSADKGDQTEADGEPRILYELARRNGEWFRALELAAAHLPQKIQEVVNQACEQAFASGSFHQVWEVLDKVDGKYLKDPDTYYWYFSAALATDRHQELLAEVIDLLARVDAPELRALLASAFPSDRSLEECRRAVQSRRNAITLKALGFCLSGTGMHEEALETLSEVRLMSLRDGHVYQAAHASLQIAHVNLSQGRYREALAVANQNLLFCSERGVKDEILILGNKNIVAYASLLLGDVARASHILTQVDSGNFLLGIPSLEGIVSTAGELAMIEGQCKRAIELFNSNRANFGGHLPGRVVVDIVKGHLWAGNHLEALEIASDAVSGSIASSQGERARLLLALGMALFSQSPQAAVGHLMKAHDYFLQVFEAPYSASAAIWLAKSLQADGRTGESREIIASASAAVEQLGDVGWFLLGGEDSWTSEVRSHYEGKPETPRLSCLGQRTLQTGAEQESIGLRWAELLTLLVNTPGGMSGQHFTFELYGDSGNQITLKATLSKLRKNLSIPISSRPYRLEEPLEADFMDLMEALEAADVERALELYRGPLLPESDAPGIVALRQHIEETLRQTVLACGDGEAVLRLAYMLHEDLEVWERALELLPSQSTQVPLVRAHIRRIQREWAVEA